MKELFWGVIFLAVLAVIGVFALDRLTASAADLAYERGQAQAAVIQAQSMANLNSAQAWAITSAATVQAVSGISGATLPWLIVLISTGIIVMGMVYLNRQPQRHEQPRIIVQPVLVLPERQAEVWMMDLQNKQNVRRDDNIITR